MVDKKDHESPGDTTLLMDWMTRHRHDGAALPADPAAAIDFLLAGNARYIAEMAANMAVPSTVPPRDGTLTSLDPMPVPKQAPCCVVLGCSDARVPLELVFDAKPNQFFVVRVAGNVLGEECLGSIEYALASFPETMQLLVVLGHTGCGAVAAAVDIYLEPKMHNSIAFSRSLRSVINHVILPVRAAALALSKAWGADVVTDPGYRGALIEAGVYLNAAMTAFQLREEVAPHVSCGKVGVVYAVYDVATCRVIGPDLDPDTDDTSKLAAAPTESDELVAIGNVIARSPMVGRHLSAGRQLLAHTDGPR